MRKIVLTLAALATSLLGADITGKWSGPVEMKQGDEVKPDGAYLVLKQEGNTITGSIGPSEEKQMPITKGTITDGVLRLEASFPERDAKVVLKLKVDGEKLVGTLETEGPEAPPISGSMVLSKI